ncbi:MAG: 30S ribosomal protein S17 [Candidatus Omnitrophica bacterium]|nr:30S ribosomal protein S17 [Candidatus Omnitrophota bacterium]
MGKRKTFIGTVVSDKMQKTRVVSILRLAKHPKYGRVLKKYNKFKAHDEKNATHIGDTVQIIETRPLSKDKYFRIAKVIKSAQVLKVQLKEEVV